MQAGLARKTAPVLLVLVLVLVLLVRLLRLRLLLVLVARPHPQSKQGPLPKERERERGGKLRQLLLRALAALQREKSLYRRLRLTSRTRLLMIQRGGLLATNLSTAVWRNTCKRSSSNSGRSTTSSRRSRHKRNQRSHVCTTLPSSSQRFAETLHGQVTAQWGTTAPLYTLAKRATRKS